MSSVYGSLPSPTLFLAAVARLSLVCVIPIMETFWFATYVSKFLINKQKLAYDQLMSLWQSS